MLKKTLKRIYRLINPQFVSIPDNTWKEIDKLSQKSIEASGEQKMGETLRLLHQIKNAQTVKTSEFEALTRLFTGQKIYVDTRDVSESPHLMLDGIRERGITKFFEEIAFDGMNYYDVGVNYGYNTLLIGKALKSSGSLHAFEANEDLIPLLNKTMSVNGLTNKARINNLAVTEKSNETVTLHRYKNLWGGSSIHSKEEMEAYRPVAVEFDKDYKVKTISIDDYYKANCNGDTVDLVKIDVEGVEDRVYAGMTEVIKHPEIHILLEFTFGAYKNEQEFFNKMQKDFAHIDFVSDETGSSTPVTDFTHLKKIAEYEWAMLHLYH